MVSFTLELDASNEDPQYDVLLVGVPVDTDDWDDWEVQIQTVRPMDSKSLNDSKARNEQIITLETA